MPSPIASRVDDPSRSWEPNHDDDATCHGDSLVAQSTSPPKADAICSSGEEADLPTRPSQPRIRGPHAEAQAENDDYYAGAFMLSGRDAASGLEAEVFSASIHQGERERAVQVAMARMGASTDDGHFSTHVEVFTAQAHAALDNPDGSTGLGASMGTTIVGVDVTGTLGPVSLTLAASVGATVGGSMGVRDGDHDGKPELCGRVDFGVAGVGVCVEKW
jgi:hypothetical protein